MLSVYIESIQECYERLPIWRECFLYIQNQNRKATQKRKASNLEGVLSLYIESIQKYCFLYIEPIQKGYTKERSLQSGGSALYIYTINTRMLREASNLEGLLSLYIKPKQKSYTKERGLQSGGCALFIYRVNTEKLHKRERGLQSGGSALFYM